VAPVAALANVMLWGTVSDGSEDGSYAAERRRATMAARAKTRGAK